MKSEIFSLLFSVGFNLNLKKKTVTDKIEKLVRKIFGGLQWNVLTVCGQEDLIPHIQ